MEPKADWSHPTKLIDLPKDGVISLDIECNNPDLTERGPSAIVGRGSVAGIALGHAAGAMYLPVGHAGGGNMDKDIVFRYVQEQIRRAKKVVFANAPFDLEWLRYGCGIEVGCRIEDVQIIEPLIDEELPSYSLDSIAYRHLGIKKQEGLLREAATAYGLDPKADMWKLPAKYVGEYAEADASLTLAVWNAQQAKIRELGIQQIYELETAIIRPLFEMRCKGVCVNMEAAALLKKEMALAEAELIKALEKEGGQPINIWSADSISYACNNLGISYPLTEAVVPKPSFTSDFLEASKHPFLKRLAEARGISKLGRDFVGKLMDWAHKGKVHATWRQLASDDGGTKTGRMSCSMPNLQQVPSRDEVWGPKIRALFIPEPGLRWCKMDYSQQEPRILIHYALLRKLEGAEAIAKAYRDDPRMDIYGQLSKVAGVTRKQSKTLTLGTLYGMGRAKLADSLGVSEAEAERISDEFNRYVPFVKQLATEVEAKAKSTGAIRTLCGRRRHFDWWKPYYTGKAVASVKGLNEARNRFNGAQVFRDGTHKALNSLIQGSAADMAKKALLDSGRIPYLMVHDEFGWGVQDAQEANELKKIAENAVPLAVPMVADCVVKGNW